MQAAVVHAMRLARTTWGSQQADYPSVHASTTARRHGGTVPVTVNRVEKVSVAGLVR